ncbi:PepSY domain-containing protein [Telmatospirillum sp.]|uniref:PepSY domain-containing protein n=1 Tax=Telmatospirillum sp. TaxID=2079197 RepID=UPI002841C9FF|nr:PepSY domain-containing protein [Telmatospirillum sp.]MDR3438651.1 PepSY domain-containing protein [Telmatospirillum sp.]
MKTIALAIVLASLLAGTPVAADSDHDVARRALEAGQILPLRDILTRVGTAFPGQMIDTDLETEGGRLVYEIKVLTSDGRVLKLLYDARTGEMLKARSRERRP